jgi:dTDP-glucose pyrophosphorylase
MKEHFILQTENIADALRKLNALGQHLTLFVLDTEDVLTGTLTDGDIRRGLLKGIQLTDCVTSIMNASFSVLRENNFTLADIDRVKSIGIKLLPVVNNANKIIKLVNLTEQRSVLPIDCVMMAGGKGERLRPLTEKTPKPLLPIGAKPIIEHGLNRLQDFGIENVTISINYLGDQIIDYLKDGSSLGLRIKYVKETQMLGTIGSVTLIEHPFQNDHVLIMNSDLLTNIDLEEFFREFIVKNADLSVACIPYIVNIPYAILDTSKEQITGLSEKPTLTYYSNAGIYLVKKDLLKLIPENAFFNATDFIELLIAQNKKVIYYPILGYWLDIGKMDDFQKAKEDIKHIKF